VKNKLHFQSEWLALVGEVVEIRLHNALVRRGTVDSVTPDGQILWVATEGADARSMFERSRGYSVWMEYSWETAPLACDEVEGCLTSARGSSPP
jgi:hypothetical protein